MENPPIQQPVFLIEANKITVNPFQPRKYFDEEKLKELASSIREYGILQPLVVTKVEEENEAGTVVKYELIAGERRLRASKLAGLERVPAVIKNVGLDRERLEMAIVENVQRADLNPIESARAYSRLQDEFNLTQREIASRIGKSREVIANTMRLLNLPTKIQDAISMGHIGESQARLLLSISDIHQQDLLFDDVIKNNMSVRELKGKIDYVKSMERKGSQDEAEKKISPLFDSEAESIKQRLEETLGTPVKVERKGNHGKITIEYYSVEELRSLLEKIITQSDQGDEPGGEEISNPETHQPIEVTEPIKPDEHYGPTHSDDGASAPVNLPVANLDDVDELAKEYATDDDKPKEFTI